MAGHELIAAVQVPGSTLGAELAALLDNSEGSDISFKVRTCYMVSTWAPEGQLSSLTCSSRGAGLHASDIHYIRRWRMKSCQRTESS